MESNKQLEFAYDFIDSTSANIFLTGKAGTGKTTFLRSLHSRINKRIVIVAPTGIAALNAGGVTLHSMFQLPFSPYVPESEREGAKTTIQIKKFAKSKIHLIRSIELLVIDEISMVRSDILDAVDETLRQIRNSYKPFGGVQLLMIGDVNQLSPIARDAEKEMLKKYYTSQYFFDSFALQKCPYVTIELEKIYRQSDKKFTTILNAVRDRKVSYDIMSQLNERYIPGFSPNEKDGYIRLTTHNSIATTINDQKLDELKGGYKYFRSTIKGDFPVHIFPNEEVLELKIGAKVIFIKNDTSTEKLYYNGMQGVIISHDDETSINVRCNDTGDEITVYNELWENIEYTLNHETEEIDEIVKGSFSQFPLKCAWAITIHKSQGLTFDNAIIDLNSAFAYGQVYVALSRCRSLEGVVLSSPLKISSIIGDNTVDQFNTYIDRNRPDNKVLEDYQRAHFESNLIEIFDYTKLKTLSYSLLKLSTINLHKSYPNLISKFTEYMKSFEDQIMKVSISFQSQIRQVIAKEDFKVSIFLKERVQRGSTYFTDKLSALFDVFTELNTIDFDSKQVRTQFKELSEQFTIEMNIKKLSFKLCGDNFCVKEYSKIKNHVIAKEAAADNKLKTKSKSASKSVSKDVIHPELYSNLIEWRAITSSSSGFKTSSILQLKSIIQIQATLPTTLKELRKITGVGTKTMENYGVDIVGIVDEFVVSNNINPNGFKGLVF